MANNAVKTRFVARMMNLHIAYGKAASLLSGNPDKLIFKHTTLNPAVDGKLCIYG
jgi:hypothetical protein